MSERGKRSNELWLMLCRIMGARTPAERFRAFALRFVTHEDDPALCRAVEALQKLESGNATPGEADLALSPLFELLNKNQEAWDDCKSLRGINFAESGPALDKSHPLYVRFRNAAEDMKGNFFTGCVSPQKFEIALYAFFLTYYNVKNDWAMKSEVTEYFVQKLEKSSLSANELKAFRQLAGETLRDWDSEPPPKFRTRIQHSAKFKARIEHATAQ